MSKTETQGTFSFLIQDALSDALTPERVKERVDRHVEKLVDATIENAMSKWSHAGKQIEAALTQSLQVGDGLNLPSYGSVVCELLSAQIQARVADVVAAKLQKDMEDLLCLAPKEVKLSKLIADLLDEEEDDPCACDPTSIHLDIEWVDDRRHIWMSINKDGEPSYTYGADIRLMVELEHPYGKEPRPEDADQWWRPTIRATICCGKVKGSDLKKDVRFGWGTDYSRKTRTFGRWFGFEQKILAMYAAGTVIELDEDACILSKYDH